MPTMTMPAKEFAFFIDRLTTFCERPKKGALGLNFLCLYARDGELYGEASDRTRVLVRKSSVHSVEEDFYALIYAEDAKAFTQHITKALKKEAIFDQVRVEVGSNGEVSVHTTLISAGRENVHACERVPIAWPKVSRFIYENRLAEKPAKFYTLNPDRIKDLGIKSESGLNRVHLWPADKGMLFFAADDDEMGVLMTVRQQDPEEASRIGGLPHNWISH